MLSDTNRIYVLNLRVAALNDVHNAANIGVATNTGTGNTSMTGPSAPQQTPSLQTREGYEVYEGGKELPGYMAPDVAANPDVAKYSKYKSRFIDHES